MFFFSKNIIEGFLTCLLNMVVFKMLAEYNFLLKNDFGKYEGNWIAIVDDKVVAVDKSAKTVYEKAKKKTGKEPLLDRVYGKALMLI